MGCQVGWEYAWRICRRVILGLRVSLGLTAGNECANCQPARSAEQQANDPSVDSGPHFPVPLIMRSRRLLCVQSLPIARTTIRQQIACLWCRRPACSLFVECCRLSCLQHHPSRRNAGGTACINSLVDPLGSAPSEIPERHATSTGVEPATKGPSEATVSTTIEELTAKWLATERLATAGTGKPYSHWHVHSHWALSELGETNTAVEIAT